MISRIDIIGQNGNTGEHYMQENIEQYLSEFIKNLEGTVDKEFLYLVLDELKERKKLIQLLKSDNRTLQEIVSEKTLG